MTSNTFGILVPGKQLASEMAYCTNCGNYYYESPDVTPDALQFFVDEDGRFKGCPKCRTDAYLLYADALEPLV